MTELERKRERDKERERKYYHKVSAFIKIHWSIPSVMAVTCTNCQVLDFTMCVVWSSSHPSTFCTCQVSLLPPQGTDTSSHSSLIPLDAETNRLLKTFEIALSSHK